VYVYFMSDNAIAHMENFSVAALQDIVIEWLISDAM